jgi:heme exporter protein A
MSARGPFQDNPAVVVEALALARGGRLLLEGLGFRADAGAYVEVRGANGAGKTSLLRAVAGFLRPRSGSVRIENVEEPALALHYVGHLNGLKGAASVRAHLRYWAGLLGGRPNEAEILNSLGLQRAADALARTLSQGQARRLALARLKVAPRPVWLLDEPAAALDAGGRAIVADMIEAQRTEGGIVVAAVHEPLGPTPSLVLTLGAA